MDRVENRNILYIEHEKEWRATEKEALELVMNWANKIEVRYQMKLLLNPK